MLVRIGKAAVAVFDVITGGIVLAIAAILTLQVVSRYLFEYPLAWPEEIAGFIFVWLIFLGTPLAYWSGKLIGIRVFLEPLPGKVGIAIAFLINALVVAFLAYLTYEGIEATLAAWNKKTTVLGFSWGWIYLALPIGAPVLAIGYLTTLARLVRGWRSGPNNRPPHPGG